MARRPGTAMATATCRTRWANSTTPATQLPSAPKPQSLFPVIIVSCAMDEQSEIGFLVYALQEATTVSWHPQEQMKQIAAPTVLVVTSLYDTGTFGCSAAGMKTQQAATRCQERRRWPNCPQRCTRCLGYSYPDIDVKSADHVET